MPRKILRIPSLAALLAAVFTLSAPLAQSAAAYRDVCMRFPAGVGYTGLFRIEYGDAAAFRNAPLINVRKRAWYWELRGLENGGQLARARGRTPWSPRLSLGRHACLSLEDVREGEHFAVLLQVDGGFDELIYLRYCRGWERGQPLVFSQNPRDTRRLTLDAIRTVTTAECVARRVE